MLAVCFFSPTEVLQELSSIFFFLMCQSEDVKPSAFERRGTTCTSAICESAAYVAANAGVGRQSALSLLHTHTHTYLPQSSGVHLSR